MLAEASLEEQIQAYRAQGISVCERLAAEIDKLDFAPDEVQQRPSYDEATFLLLKDPLTGDRNLTGYWNDAARHQRLGSLQFNSDGSVYAEFDVSKPHPSKPKWFVEAVTVWGKQPELRGEAKLLRMPE